MSDAVGPQVDEDAMAKEGRRQPFDGAATGVQISQRTGGRKRGKPPQSWEDFIEED